MSLGIRELNPVRPMLVKFSLNCSFGLARRQPCFTLQKQLNKNFSAHRVEEFKKSKFFARKGKSAGNPRRIVEHFNALLRKICLFKPHEFDSLMPMPQLSEDKDFYQTSGGGVTLSGGECLAQADFCAELLKTLKSAGINTAVDTCGFVLKEAIDKVLPYTDEFLYDIKAFDEETHIRCTGRSNALILENLKYICEQGSRVEVRLPYVPEYNENQVEKIAAYLARLKNITRVKILPCHNYSGSKYGSLEIPNTLPSLMPTEEDIIRAKDIIVAYGLNTT